MANEEKTELTRLLVPLYKGVVYRDSDEAYWARLVARQIAVGAHFEVLGLELHLEESEGFAYLKTKAQSEEEGLPRLIPRRQLSYNVSLLLALLRKKMAEADAGSGETRLILTRDQIVDLVRIFLPSGTNEARMSDQVVSALGKVEELGFVRRLGGQNDSWEVRRILKAFVDAQWLGEFEQRLASYSPSGDQDGQ
jgi:hypothetical protein